VCNYVGTARPTQVIVLDSDSSQEAVVPCVTASVCAVESAPSRTEQLFDQLNLPLNFFMKKEAEEIEALIKKFSDVLAFFSFTFLVMQNYSVLKFAAPHR